MAAALQIWSPTFSKAFDSLPASVRDAVQRKVDDMGSRLGNFPHQRLQGRPEFKLRAGEYRVLYEFDVKQGRIYLHYVGHRRDIYKRPSEAERRAIREGLLEIANQDPDIALCNQAALEGALMLDRMEDEDARPQSR